MVLDNCRCGQKESRGSSKEGYLYLLLSFRTRVPSSPNPFSQRGEVESSAILYFHPSSFIPHPSSFNKAPRPAGRGVGVRDRSSGGRNQIPSASQPVTVSFGSRQENYLYLLLTFRAGVPHPPTPSPSREKGSQAQYCIFILHPLTKPLSPLGEGLG